MAIIITDECIVCNACEPECPNNAIYPNGVGWNFSDGTELQEIFAHPELGEIDPTIRQNPISDTIYYIVPYKCTECEGFHEEPQCAAVCPVDCCVPDPDNEETKEILTERKKMLHNE